MTTAARLPSQRTHIAAVIACLDTHFTGLGATVDIEDSHNPRGSSDGWAGTPGQSDYRPVVVVYDIGGTLDGPIAGQEEDVALRIQLTCVGARPDQARWAADEATEALVTTTITIADRTVTYVRPDGPDTVRRDDDIAPPLFYLTPRFTLSTTPT